VVVREQRRFRTACCAATAVVALDIATSLCETVDSNCTLTFYPSLPLSLHATVEVTIDARKVTVTGPRGTLSRAFRSRHMDMMVVGEPGAQKIRIDLWFGIRKQIALTRTIASHVNNMFIGVTSGFQYKMRLVYNHFPITGTVTNGGKTMEIRNFLGERRLRTVKLRPGVTVEKSSDVKDQFVFTGNNIEAISRSCAEIHQQTLVRDKDIRKFLDGIYVSEKGAIPTPEE
jgi:large subunit ribosomal protein L9e